MSLREKLALLQASLPTGVRLVAVSKFRPVATIREAYETGQRIFGENRVQELLTKQPHLPDDIEWHLIGFLQTNKVKFIAPFISMIQSVDSLKLLQEIDRQAERCGRFIRVLIEVHIAAEESKHGFSIDECKALFASDLRVSYPHIRICGLMAMATFTDDTAQVRSEFRTLRALFDEISTSSGVDPLLFKELSMGMSDDYPIAIEEGSTMVRIGSAIFNA